MRRITNVFLITGVVALSMLNCKKEAVRINETNISIVKDSIVQIAKDSNQNTSANNNDTNIVFPSGGGHLGHH